MSKKKKDARAKAEYDGRQHHNHQIMKEAVISDEEGSILHHWPDEYNMEDIENMADKDREALLNVLEERTGMDTGTILQCIREIDRKHKLIMSLRM